MKKYKKLYYKITNPVVALALRLLGNKGLLPTREDRRDRISNLGGGEMPKNSIPDLRTLIQFNQVNNICTAASTIKGLSEQIGINLSVKACMMKMVKDGQVSGDGFSHQRAPLNVIVNDGVVLYEDMPDENDKGWNDYRKWDSSVYKKAIKFDNVKYERVKSEKAVAEAISLGYSITFASKWYSDSNYPQAPRYLLRFTGWLIGGHAYRLRGYRNYGEDFQKMGTFGESWGDKGRAWLRTLIGKNFYKAWIISFDGKPTPPAQLLIEPFARQNEGKMVKAEGDVKCYVIQNGMRHHVSGEDGMKTYFKLESEVGLTIVKKELLEALPQGENYPLTK